MTEIINSDDLENWLGNYAENEQASYARLIAARASLRILPATWPVLPPSKDAGARLLLPTLRANFNAHFIGAWPELITGRWKRDAVNALEASRKARGLAFSYLQALGGTKKDLAGAVFSCSAAYYALAFAIPNSNLAVLDAVDAATRNFADGAADVETAAYAAVSRDANAIESGASLFELSTQPLWHSFRWGGGFEWGEGHRWSPHTPDWAKAHWASMKSYLLSLDQDWEVWTDWYDARLAGGWQQPHSAALEQAITEIDDALWKGEPAMLNAEIARLGDLHRSGQGDASATGPTDAPDPPVDRMDAASESVANFDFRHNAQTNRMDAVEFPADRGVVDDESAEKERRDLMFVLKSACADFSADIRKHKVNVPPGFREDLNRYGTEAAKSEDAVAGRLKYLGDALVRAQRDDNVRFGLGD